MTQHFAVIGNPIGHSLSPLVHQQFALQTGETIRYEKILGDDLHVERQIADFFHAGGAGLNVTLPYKQRAFALAENVTPRCALAKAANTLWMQEQALHADNTDGAGLIRDLSRHLALQNTRILILGAGGAARGIIDPLRAQQPAEITLSNRSATAAEQIQREFPQLAYQSFDALCGEFDLIINATSAENPSIPASVLQHKPFCYDLRYQQKEDTPFVHHAKSQGCKAADGLGMLLEQAAEAFFIWTGKRPGTDKLLTQLRAGNIS